MRRHPRWFVCPRQRSCDSFSAKRGEGSPDKNHSVDPSAAAMLLDGGIVVSSSTRTRPYLGPGPRSKALSRCATMERALAPRTWFARARCRARPGRCRCGSRTNAVTSRLERACNVRKAWQPAVGDGQRSRHVRNSSPNCRGSRRLVHDLSCFFPPHGVRRKWMQPRHSMLPVNKSF